MVIPRLLHQIWLGDQSKRPQAWMDTWKAKHPGWEYRLWTEENLPFTPLKGLSYSGQSDVLRYQLLYEYGGVYVDADSECLNAIDELCNGEAFCSWENEYVTTGLMLGAFMGSVPDSSLFRGLLYEIGMTTDFNPEWFTVGPGLLTRVVGKLKYQDMTIYPSHYFSPTHHSGLKYTGKGKVYANHFWDSTPKLTSEISPQGFRYVDNS